MWDVDDLFLFGTGECGLAGRNDKLCLYPAQCILNPVVAPGIQVYGDVTSPELVDGQN